MILAVSCLQRVLIRLLNALLISTAAWNACSLVLLCLASPLHPSQGCRSSSAAQPCLAQVHFDCLYKGIDVASSRSARLLGGNRTIAEVHTFCSCPPILGITCLNVLGERFPMQTSCILHCKRSCCGKHACSAEPIQCACARHQAFAWSLAMQVAIRMRSLAQLLGLLCCDSFIPRSKPIAAVGRRRRSLEATHILSNGWLVAGLQFLVAYCCVLFQHDACTFVRGMMPQSRLQWIQGNVRVWPP